ncbi:hypothetical protein BDZ89DRAFT_1138535 [Hymenopellis radicata]|nr:hypothetical protein BDZ89DRAFT_1138535 [Hymenopellis radicata]
MASRPSTEPDNAVQQSRPALLGLLRTRSKSRSHKRGISTPEPPSPSPLVPSFPRGRRGGQSIGGDAGWTGLTSPPPLQMARRVSANSAVVAQPNAFASYPTSTPDAPTALASLPAICDQAIRLLSWVALRAGRGTTTTGKIAFKSKIVSRTHAELWMDNGGSIMVDTESKWFPLADGDILQLGVDYQGGLEDAYKAVKIRVEIGREPETAFDTSALRALNALAKSESQPSTESKKQIIPDCCICLCGISVRQALFTTPCCHTFHFKCIRPLIDAVPKTPMLTH